MIKRTDMRELVLRLVWGAGEPRAFDSRVATGPCSLLRACVSLVKNPEAFSRQWSMILERWVNEVGKGKVRFESNS